MDKLYPEVTFDEDMMSQRFTLFYAGFTAYVPSLYYAQLEFADTCRTTEDHALSSYMSRVAPTLEEQLYEITTHMNTAISVAKYMEVEIPPEPGTYADYFDWLRQYTESFEQKFPMGRIDHYYFLFARKIAEINCNLRLLKFYIDLRLSVGDTVDLSRQMEKCLKDTEYILFKLMAAAALLSSEPRQNYFNVFYRLLCQEFQQFKQVDVKKLNDAELKKLRASLEEFDLGVIDGFKKCIGLLKELGI